MTKKDKKPKISTIVTKEGDTVKVFEDLDTFETFIKNETEDEEFDHVNCHLKYYPPFVLHESHEDPEKIKETVNSHNRKFVRHLHQHVEKHLLKDIRERLQLPQLKFNDKSKEETPDHIVWRYNQRANFHERDFDIHVTVECHHDSALVDVDYLTVPVPAVAAA
ncbi:Respiratory growth induced protein 1 [Lachancea thermotolerans]|uniref:Respiratory growth induced protein 1 n=1 Tax=Lachancea thermotolerans (strain ATCC 56472 / CBS 6340 / NRRL Y-8284) TaxID=559295 RepID=RGI1_LACTC|nr:KLTH0A04510p [Lachancea thermotolerans CBS 6340]C5DBQ3.1 RecName: Full=Respiratory growth induced protein 1 [Lachancea thermotolerans CBS 6340]CAR21210.1 KLTH0A04510p [Lachancea thermotolerans CBS 6340]